MTIALPIAILVVLAAVVTFHAYTQRDSNDHH